MAGSILNRQLGDTHLNPEESVIKLREELLKTASKSKIHGQAKLEDPDRAAGPRIPYTDLIRRLRKLNPSIQVRDGMEGSVALYRHKFPWEYNESQRDINIDSFFWDHLYVGGFKKDWIPEYAYILLDTSNLPTREIRGWRSVLLQLIKSNTISLKDAIQEFGDPSLDQRGERWMEQIWEFRNKSLWKGN